MQVIKRLQQLREEHNDLQKGRGEVMVTIIKLEGQLKEAQQAKRNTILERFRSGQPIMASTLEARTEQLSVELQERRSIIEAIDSKLAEIGPELDELEQAQKEASLWWEFAVNFLAGRAIRGEIRDTVRRAFEAAPEKRVQSVGQLEHIEKSIPLYVGARKAWWVGRCDTEAMKIAHKIDAEVYPRIERIDLTTESGKEMLFRAWDDFLLAQRRFLQDYDWDISPDDSDVNKRIKEIIPS